MAQTLRRTAVQARGRNGYVGFSSLVRSAIFDAARERDECKVVSDHEIHVQLQTAVLQLSVPKLEDPSSDFQVLRHFVLPVEARDVGKVTILARDVFPELDHRVFTASAAKDATSGRVTVSTPYVYVAFMSNAIHREPQLGTVISEARSVEEALFILSHLDKKYLSDFAVLYRTNAQSRSLEEQFLKSGIPYKLVGGISFYQRKEIKDVLAYLRLIQNPKDSVSLKRAEKVGKGRLAKVMEISADAQKATIELLDLILQKTGYLAYLDDGTDEGKGRVENVKELRSVAEEFPSLTDFLENVALVEASDIPKLRHASSRGNDDAVTLMTLHSAKGLVFPTVFMVGMEEGLFPHSRSMLNVNELEEERRLCYVGITRAKEKLYLTYTRQRLYFGTRSNNLVSRFLSDIPENLVTSNATFKDQDNFSDDFSDDIDKEDWLNA